MFVFVQYQYATYIRTCIENRSTQLHHCDGIQFHAVYSFGIHAADTHTFPLFGRSIWWRNDHADVKWTKACVTVFVLCQADRQCRFDYGLFYYFPCHKWIETLYNLLVTVFLLYGTHLICSRKLFTVTCGVIDNSISHRVCIFNKTFTHTISWIAKNLAIV